MANANHQRNRSETAATEYSIEEILLPDGYELAHYTLRRVYDGHLQSYLSVNTSFTPVQTIPMPAQLSETPAQDLQGNSNDQSSTFSLPIRSSNGNHTNAKKLSETTRKRHAHARDDDYTDVCGVVSPAKANPVKRINPGKGEFCCPRCGSNFTRPKSVKDHFPDCVAKYGNPKGLRYTDHPSMAQKEAAIKRRRQESRGTSGMDGEDEMSDTRAITPIGGVHNKATAHDGQHIKSEFVFGADVAHESVETPQPEYRPRSISRDDRRTSAKPTPPIFSSKTPEWQTATSPRSTPNPHRNRWNIGIPGAAAEHDIVDSRATAPFEGWPSGIHTWPTEPQTWLSELQAPRSSGSQTPQPTHREGFQADGLDDFMDRRSYFSPTPAASYPSHRTKDVGGEDGMEE